MTNQMVLSIVRERKKGPGIRLNPSLSLGEWQSRKCWSRVAKRMTKETGELQYDYSTEQFSTWNMAMNPGARLIPPLVLNPQLERNPRGPTGAGWERGSQRKWWATERILPWLYFHMDSAWESWCEAEPSLMISFRVRRKPKSTAPFGVEQQKATKEVAGYKKMNPLTTFSSSPAWESSAETQTGSRHVVGHT